DISLMAHYGYGAATGALYPLAARLAGGPPLATGVTYGVIVWAASYLGWIPITGTLTRATRHSPRRNALMIAAHAVWGGCTAVIAESLQRSPAGFGAAGGAVVPVPPEIPQSRVGPPATARPRRERSDRLWGLAAAAAAGGALAWGLGMRPATRRAPRP
ncbi:MAG TPA: hypothetical protein VFO41_12500, partial [Alphaproteobacteria bacterium]|nr:hypothetical protein [Alphaproteobacteria bacterium]